MTAARLSAFDRWMVEQNVRHARTEGFAVVVARLRANGYVAVADAVAARGGS